MRRFIIIFSVCVVGVSVLLLSGGIAFAATSVDGFNDSLLALLDGLKAYFEAVIEILKLIL